jgi:site-specific recombinase XerD
MRLDGKVSLQGERKFRGEQATSTSKTITLGLTDHNNEYLTATIISQNDARDIILSSRYNLGSFGSFSATSLSSTNRGHLKSLTHEMKDERSSIRTTVGITDDARRFFEFLREERLSKTSSVAISLKTDSEKKTTLIYQYRMQLK